MFSSITLLRHNISAYSYDGGYIEIMWEHLAYEDNAGGQVWENHEYSHNCY